MKKRSDNKTRVFNNILAIAGLAAVMLLCMLSCSGGVDVTEQDRVLTSFSLTWPSGFDNTCLSNEPVTVIIKALDQNGTHFTGWSGSVDIELTNASVDVTPAAVNLTAGIVERSIAFDNTSSEDQETGMTLSAEGVVTDLGVTVLVYTAEAAAPSGFGLAWPSGFDYTCASNEPLDVTVEALDQNGDLLDWSGSVDLVPTNTNVTVNPSTVNLASGTVQKSIAFRNDTVQSQETVITLTDGNTVTELPDTVLVYETIPPSDVEDFEAVPWDGQIGLSWTSPPELDFAGVRILRSTSGPPSNPGDGDLVYEGADEEYVDTGLTNGTTYYYTAFSHDYAPNYSNGVTKNGTPEARSVGSIRCFPGNGKVTLYWDEEAGADSYTVYYTGDGTDPGPSNYAGMIRDIQDTEYEVGELANFTVYKFTVTSAKGGMESRESLVLREIPPGNMTGGGWYHTMSIEDDGTVWTWGRNDYGQLGNGTTGTDSDYPVRVVDEDGEGALAGAAAVVGGYVDIIALKNDGTVWAWGGNGEGQLGNGNMGTGSDRPIQVKGEGGSGYLTDVVAVASGSAHVAAVRNDGTAWTWGYNYSGQLGNGITGENSDLPVQVKGEEGTGFLTGVVAVAAGEEHSVALKGDGTVWAWGNNLVGQLGNGNMETDSPTPVRVVGEEGTGYLTGVVAVAAGSAHSVALKNDGTVWTWGKNEYGQLGDENMGVDSDIPVQVKGEDGEGTLDGVAAVTAGYGHSVALKNDGTVWSWGYNQYGQLGDANHDTHSDTPVQVKGEDGIGFLTDTVAVEAGSYICIALKNDGTVWTWGGNQHGGLGNGTHGLFNWSDTPVQVIKALREVTEVAAGSYHTVALKTGGTVWTWGDNDWGQLGDDNSGTDSGVPVQVVGEGGSGFLTDVTAISSDSLFSAALKDDGTEKTVWTWGYNYNGQLGNGNHGEGADSDTPVQVVGEGGIGFLTDMVAVVAGNAHTVALKDDGEEKTVWTWGANGSGQLGNDTHGGFNDTDTPVQVVGEGGIDYLTDVVAVAAGYNHTMALKNDNTVWTWGENDHGQLGNDDIAIDTDTPVQVVGKGGIDFLTDIATITAGSDHNMVVKDDGTVWTWGKNDRGQLGNGNTGTDSDTPVQVVGADGTGFLTGVVTVSAGKDYSLAIKDDGTVWTWGKNDRGQLGDDNTGTDSDMPVQVSGVDGTGFLTDVSAAAACFHHTAAVKNDGTVWTWGDNYYGQLGDGNKGTDSDTPVPLSFLYLGWND